MDYSVENYGQYAVFNPPLDILIDRSQINQECTNTVANMNLSSQTSGWYCASSSGVFVAKKPRQLDRRKTLHPRSHAMSYSIIIDDENGNGNGVNITLSSQVCPSSIMGDLMSPQGELMKNVTMARIHDTIRSLSLKEQQSYLRRLLQGAKDAIDTQLQEFICDSQAGGNRALLWQGQRYHDVDMSGYWAYGLTAAPILFGVAWAGAWGSGYGGIEAQFSNVTKTSITAGAAVLFFGVTKLWDKFQADGNFQSMEAIVASAFVAAVNGFVAVMRYSGSGACLAGSAVLKGIKDLWDSCQCCGPQAIGDGNAPGIQMQPQSNNNPAAPQAGPLEGQPGVIGLPQC